MQKNYYYNNNNYYICIIITKMNGLTGLKPVRIFLQITLN